MTGLIKDRLLGVWSRCYRRVSGKERKQRWVEGERVTTEGKGRGEVGGEAVEVTEVVADAPTTDVLGKRYGTFSGWGRGGGQMEK